jgi:deoxycytidylate deaminase
MSSRVSNEQPIELVFGIAGPIGVNIEAISDSLTNALRAVRYQAHSIHLTKKMLNKEQYRLRTETIQEPTETDFYSEVNFKIKYANALCTEFGDPATLARIAIRAIGDERAAKTADRTKLPKEPTAYIIRQLKRPDEAMLLRRVYGKQFVLVSAYGPVEQRQKLIEERLKRTLPPATAAHEISHKALELIEKDGKEDDEFGQNLRETFHLADVFIDGMSRQEMDAKLNRFVEAFFGRTDIAPSKEEYGMYAAKSASLRSSDLSRQVGAAIFSDDGELITQGCNEVPKAFGGTYWDLEEPDYRDVRIGYDPNDVLKKEILRELFDSMSKNDLLSEKATAIGSPGKMVDVLTKKKLPGSAEKDGDLAHCAILDLTEFGRVVHAEMCAICDAARLGRSLKGSTLFCTTFPCHNCTKHILAAGLKKVIYMEPYPKSRAKELHANEIEIEKETPGRVSFVPFLGISPLRYRDIFQKGKRKNADGSAKRWMSEPPTPSIDISSSAYIELESIEWGKLILKIERDDTPPAIGQPPA